MQNNHLFFSIIIPAHNEERYIAETLRHIHELDYPAHRFCAIVVENGSTDKTFAKAKEFEKGNITVVSSSTKGVSAAKNLGIDKMPAGSDWTIFLDADTILKKDFLKELNAFLLKNREKKFTVGTVSIQPLSDSKQAHFWFSFYDMTHRITKASYSLQIFKSPILGHIRFDERLNAGEDLALIRAAEKHGTFFFFPTKNVFTSVRRFENEGWWWIFFSWTFIAILPKSIQKRFGYKVVR